MKTMHWPGLDSYNEQDSSLFFGREKEINELYDNIFHNLQNIIYGPSGIGKTSIIKAGIFTKARKNDFFPVYIRLNHGVDEMPYSEQIINAIKETAKKENIYIEKEIEYVDKEHFSMWEFFHCNKFWSMYDLPVTPLFVIDQFEELFTLGKNKQKTNIFFNELSNLCDDVAPKYIKNYLESAEKHTIYPENIDYRCIISLREDFLPRLEEYADHIPFLKRNRYSLQAINEEQAMEIITKPEKGLVTEDVAVTIIQKVTNRNDFKIDGIPKIEVEPSLLSLFCNVLDRKRIERGEKVISMELVNEFGENIIKDFYVDKISHVSDKAINYLESKLLTDDGYRDNVALNDALHNGISKEELDFLQKNRLIRIEDKNGIKRIEFTHDVLCKVANEHKEERKLQEERSKRIEIEQKAIQEKIISRKKIRRLSISVTILLLIITIGVYSYYDCYIKEYKVCYLMYTKQYGWPIGVGKELNKRDCKHLEVYYQLSRKGRLYKNPFTHTLRPFTCVETLNNHDELTENNEISIPLVDKSEAEKGKDRTCEANFAKLQEKACKWEFLSDSKGNFYKEIVYSKYGEVLYVYNVTNNLSGNNSNNNNDLSSTNKIKSLRGTYYDNNGMPIKLRDNGAQTILIAYDSSGFECQYKFLDSQDNPCVNYDNAYGLEYKHDRIGRITYVKLLDKFENTLSPDSCNYNYQCYVYDGNSAIVKDIKNYLLGKYRKPTSETLKDIQGRDSVSYLFSGNGALIPDTCSITLYKYKGIYCSEKDYLKPQMELWVPKSNELYSRKLYDYDEYGHIVSEKFYSGKKLVYEEQYTYEKNYNIYNDAYKTIAKDLIISFSSIDYQSSTNHLGIEERYTYDKNCEQSSDTYYDTNGHKKFYEGFHKCLTIRKRINNSIKIKIQEFKGFNNELRNDGSLVLAKNDTLKYAIDSIVYINNLKVYEIHKNAAHEIMKSIRFYYDKFGEVIAQSVIGLCGYPIRCSEYDNDGLSYYKIFHISNSQDDRYLQSENEFGDEDYIQKGNSYFHNGSFRKIPSYVPWCIYLRITSFNSLSYKAGGNNDGIRDNDILIQLGKWHSSINNQNTRLLNEEWNKIGTKPINIIIARIKNGKYITKKFILYKGKVIGIDKSIFYIKSKNEINRLQRII